MNSKIFIPENVARQAHEECNQESTVLAITQRMERNNPLLIKAVRSIGAFDTLGGIVFVPTCALIYRMFEIQGNLPIVSAFTFKEILMERINGGTGAYEFLMRKKKELQEKNPHVEDILQVCSCRAGDLRPDLKEKVYGASVGFYTLIVAQIESSG